MNKKDLEEVKDKNLIRRGLKEKPAPKPKPVVGHYFRVRPVEGSGVHYVLEHVTIHDGVIVEREETTGNDISITLDKAERALISFRDEK